MALTVFIIGAGSILVQTVLLRKLLSVFSGNELHIGLGLAVWLLSSGAGAISGRRLKKDILGWLLIITGIISPLNFILTELIRPLSSSILGENVTIGKTLLWTFLTLSPASLLFGGLFSSSIARWNRGPLIFCLEAAGAFLGGICFVYLFSERIDSLFLIHITGIMLFLTGLILLNKRILLALLLVFPVFYIAGIKAQELQWRPFRLMELHESRYQEIAVLSDSSHSVLYTAGRFFYTYPDILRDERNVHIAMSLHPSPERILIIGGRLSELREFFKYPLKKVDLIEIDPLLINLSKKLLTKEDRAFLEDRRLRIITGDPRHVVKGLREKYDLIILHTPEPETALLSRYYTIEFFRQIKELFDGDGLLFMCLPVSYGYISRPLMRLNGTIYSTLKSVFLYTGVSSEEYGILFASDSPVEIIPSILVERFRERGISVRYFEPSLFHDIFSPLKTRQVEERLSQIKELNTDTAPVAYLYNLLFWAYAEKGMLSAILDIRMPALIVFIFLIFLLAFFALKRAVSYMIYSTGFTTIALQIILLLHYQTLFGYVYERIGLLSSFFMLGLAAGSWLFSEKGDLKKLILSEALFIFLIAFSSYFLKGEVTFYLISFISGFLGGLQFSMAGNLMMDRVQTASLLYGIDLTGSFAGALITALYLIPLAGMMSSLMILGIIKLSSFIFLVAKK